MNELELKYECKIIGRRNVCDDAIYREIYCR